MHATAAVLRSSFLAVWIALGPFATVHAQQKPAPKPFDVAAIKPNKTGSNDTSARTSHGRLTATNLTARTLILRAFQIKEAQLSGGPDWINTHRFDISAKTDDQSISDDDLWLSLQPVLADRFDLKFHRETRLEPVLSLVVDKVKPGLVPHTGTGEPSSRTAIGGGKASLTASNVSMAKLSSSLADFTGHVVLDNTRLNGGFDFKLSWDQDHSGESTLSSVEESLGITGPSVYTALQEQLGLKLQRATGPVEHLIVDSIDHPTAH